MPLNKNTDPKSLVDSWLTSADGDNPAGPLFTSRFAEAELAIGAQRDTNLSVCTGSHTVVCC